MNTCKTKKLKIKAKSCKRASCIFINLFTHKNQIKCWGKKKKKKREKKEKRG